MTYTAPATKVLTVVHIPDPEMPPTLEPASDGQTRCGQPMLAADLWLPVDLRDGDSICRACQGNGDEQEALL